MKALLSGIMVLASPMVGVSRFAASPKVKTSAFLSPGLYFRSFVVIHPLKPGSYGFFDEFHPELPPGVIEAR